VKDEMFIRTNLDLAGQIRLFGRRVDLGIAMVLKDAKEAVESDIDRGGLNHLYLEWFDPNAT